MKRLLCLILMTLFAAGCSSRPTTTFVQPGKSYHAMLDDFWECVSDVTSGSPSCSCGKKWDEPIEQCMRSKGYKVVPVPEKSSNR